MKPVIVSGSRADRFHLQPLIDKTGWEVIETLLDSMRDVIYYMGKRLEDAEMVVLLGDRYEIFAVAIAAYQLGIPIAHLHGGERTDGSMDDAYRHCITKLSHLHFTATEEYRARVIQLGESPDRVFNVGAIRFDGWRKSSLKFLETFDRPVGLVAYNPHIEGEQEGIDALVEVINSRKDVYFMISAPTEEGCPLYAQLVDRCHRGHVAQTSMGDDFLDILSECAFIIGNSSAGIIEAPHVKTPTINIGTRQAGRVSGCSVFHVPADPGRINDAIACCLEADWGVIYDDLYYQGGAVDKIIEVIETYEHKQKTFYDCQPRDFYT